MQVELWQAVGGAAAGLLSFILAALRISRNSRDDLLSRIHETQKEITEWQKTQLALELARREKAEGLQKELEKRCDDRIDDLRKKYDDLLDKYVRQGEQLAEYRLEAHGCELRGGERAYDPKGTQKDKKRARGRRRPELAPGDLRNDD